MFQTLIEGGSYRSNLADPVSLEIYALQRLPRRTFGVLLSVEPAVAALAGVLGEALSSTQWLGIAGVVPASLGGALAVARRPT